MGRSVTLVHSPEGPFGQMQVRSQLKTRTETYAELTAIYRLVGQIVDSQTCRLP